MIKFIDKQTIQLDKELNIVDHFAFRFIELLEKYTNYVVISGYVAILFGRNRSTEDIDIIIPEMSREKFTVFYEALLQQKLWCLNSSEIEDMYDLLRSRHSIRFAEESQLSPNIEIKFAKNYYDNLALSKPITLLLGNKKIKTSFLELQIAYKEEVLKSNKDLEDARHLRIVAKGHLDEALINHYKKELQEL